MAEQACDCEAKDQATGDTTNQVPAQEAAPAAGAGACCCACATDDQAAPAAEAASAPSVTIEPVADEIDFATFSKSDMRVVKVLDCVAVKKSKKLLQFTLDDGSGTPRTILSGIHAYYEPEELVGKNVVAIVNIPPRPMMGIDSCGMLLSAIHEQDGVEQLNLLMVDPAIPAGSKLY
jgi:methionine--tRNA ligase beta chain